jgi:VanZ family protein
MVSGRHPSDRKRSGFALSKRLLRAVWLAAILAVIVGSLLPSKAAPIQMLERLPLSDKVEHVAMYALLAFLPAIHERRTVAIKVALGAIALGVGLEFAQFLTGWRDFEIGDMIANAVGVCVGLASGAAVRTRVRHRLY